MAAGDLVIPSEGMTRRLAQMLRWFETDKGTVEAANRAVQRQPTLTVPVYNNFGVMIPRGAVVRLTGVHTDLISHEISQFNYPVLAFAITSSDIPDSAYGRAYIPTPYRCYSVLVNAIASVAVGDRIGPVAGQWGMAKDYMGDFIVHSKTDLEMTTTTTGAQGIVLCEYVPVDAPWLLVTTDHCYDNEITAKQVDENCAPTGENRTFAVCGCDVTSTEAPTTTTEPASTTEGATTTADPCTGLCCQPYICNNDSGTASDVCSAFGAPCIDCIGSCYYGAGYVWAGCDPLTYRHDYASNDCAPPTTTTTA